MLKIGSMEFLDGARILITGGTGSLGQELTELILSRSNAKTVVILSRDEYKQHLMAERFSAKVRERINFFLGDVRDKERLVRAMERVDYVIHAAALKQVPAAEYNPFEFVKTNIMGAENVINAAIESNVDRVVALSTDKAANPINLYGATKLCSDKLFVAGNSYSGLKRTCFSVVRYGNVAGSRGSVIPLFLKEKTRKVLPITDIEMTRFWITLSQAAALVLNVLRTMWGAEIWVPRLPSMKIMDVGRVIGPDCEQRVIGMRPGEKLHEVMIPVDEGARTVSFDDYYVIVAPYCFNDKMATLDHYIEQGGKLCPKLFCYSSDNNDLWLRDEELREMIASLPVSEAYESTNQN